MCAEKILELTSFSYIDPGTTSLVFSSLGYILSGIILTFVIGYRWIKRIFKFIIRKIKEHPILSSSMGVGILLLTTGITILFFFKEKEIVKEKAIFNKVVLIGFDGMDPNLLSRFMEDGELPNFNILKKRGDFFSLNTSNPPQSPVAWGSIATGSNPGRFGIFDFIERSPENYLPHLSILKTKSRAFGWLFGSSFQSPLMSEPFWETIARYNIPAIVIKWPNTFPPDGYSAKILAGLGVPDLKGTLGRYTFLTTEKVAVDNEDVKGDIIYLRYSSSVEASIPGPEFISIGGKKRSKKGMKIIIGDDRKGIAVIDGVSYELKEKQWSQWISLKFNTGLFKRVNAITRFYPVQLKPSLKLYIAPLEIDPFCPSLHISQPNGYSREIAEAIGYFHTIGLPHDTNALVDGVYSEEAFLDNCTEELDERKNILMYELNRFRKGLLAVVFDNPDSIQHIFWRTIDPLHPLYDKEYNKKYGLVIKDYYRKLDGILGEVLKMIDDNTLLVVFSDHGFTSFRRSVNLNNLLVKEGIIKLINNSQNTRRGLLLDIDWEHTKAYSLGFGSIYLNLKGREAHGIVNMDEAPDILSDIKSLLEQLSDPQNNSHVVDKVYYGKDLYEGPYKDRSPDLIVGFKPGYRASWQSAIGGVSEEIFSDNLKKWSGDHCVDPQSVPGIILMNRKINPLIRENIMDVAPTVLKALGVDLPDDYDGKSLL